jgi:hypothetical protein
MQPLPALQWLTIAVQGDVKVAWLFTRQSQVDHLGMTSKVHILQYSGVQQMGMFLTSRLPA